jgi:predicted phosphodiesterase
LGGIIFPKYKVNIMVTGHTHVRKYEQQSGVIYLNPGSIGVPKGDGIPSAAIYENGTINFININNGDIIQSYNF